MPTVKKKCTCRNLYQDRRYGKQIRVFNVSDKHNLIRCTSCAQTTTRN